MCYRIDAIRFHIPGVWLVLALLVTPAHAGAAAQWGYVRWVNDGDTVILSDDRRVRYIGIDAPEMAREHQPAEPYAKTATKTNRDFVYQKRIRLEVGGDPVDRYGRVLAYVFLPDGRFVNEALVRAGVATVLPKAPNSRYEQRLLLAQRSAMSTGEGMWHRWQPRKMEYLGNRRSKRFHHPSCSRAARIHAENRVAFESLWDAFWAGYAPAKGCLPNPISP